VANRGANSSIAASVNIDVPTCGDMGELPSTLPSFLLPNVPFNAETLQIIFPYAVTLAIRRATRIASNRLITR
jgi:SulP family sulfate permease